MVGLLSHVDLVARGGPNELIDSSTKTVAEVEETIQQNGRETGRTVLEGGVNNFSQAKQ